MKKRRPIERLSGLSASSKRLFRTLCAEYGIVDTGGCETLRSGLRSLEQDEAGGAAALRRRGVKPQTRRGKNPSAQRFLKTTGSDEWIAPPLGGKGHERNKMGVLCGPSRR